MIESVRFFITRMLQIRLVLLVSAFLGSALTCTDFNCAKTKTYTINSWSGASWEFTGFAVGPSSGDHYHLVSSSTNSQ